ncbi:helix-turn-helix domain-containing protein [Prolixibacteraceae bacterium Z1-6]|uniref:Helix-turn-helix domain-containing protein n=1 Tax=Draconibacterium aestuarii TaxID=2998507 RepID=A0A9X3FA14_9BACT|nr:helix-turn-helix domain-containing protein [Prolixibacteraceae bacterium Z1-6]
MNLTNLPEQQFLSRLKEIILSHLEKEDFGVEELAREAGVSSSILRRRFHTFSEKSLSRFIREIRLQKALELLQKEDLTAAEVAYKVGFGSPAYFNTCFHNHFGFAPGEAKNRQVIDSEENNEVTSPDFEDSSQKLSRKISKRKIIFFTVGGILILFVVYLIFNNLSFESFSILPGDMLKPEDKSIAVLPFENLSGEEENQYFADGVTENILNNLIQIQEIKVINSPVKAFGENSKDFRKMANSLGVRFILWGSVQQLENKVVIIAKLVDLKRNNQLIWSDKYNKKLTDIFQVQSDIAKQVASELQTIIPQNEKKRIEKVPTVSQEAYMWYSMGRYLINKRVVRDDDTLKYINPFKNAITEDPNYAEAYAGLAEVYLTLTRRQCYPRPEGFEKAKENVLHALILDSNLAEAHAILGSIYRCEWKWEEARKELETALNLNPNNAIVQGQYGDLMYIFRNREAYKIHKLRAAELNPISPYLISFKASVYKMEGNFEKAMEEYNRYIELYPLNYSIYWVLWHFFRGMGEEQKAVEALQKGLLLTFTPADSVFSYSLPLIYKNKGIKGVERSLYEHNISFDLKGSWRGLARYCVETGDKEKALDWLEKAYEWEIPNLPTINGDLDFDPLRNEPRFQALLDSMGLSKYQ